METEACHRHYSKSRQSINYGDTVMPKEIKITSVKAFEGFKKLYNALDIKLTEGLVGFVGRSRQRYDDLVTKLKSEIGYADLDKVGKERASNKFRYIRVTYFPKVPSKGTGKQASTEPEVENNAVEDNEPEEDLSKLNPARKESGLKTEFLRLSVKYGYTFIQLDTICHKVLLELAEEEAKAKKATK